VVKLTKQQFKIYSITSWVEGSPDEPFGGYITYQNKEYYFQCVSEFDDGNVYKIYKTLGDYLQDNGKIYFVIKFGDKCEEDEDYNIVDIIVDISKEIKNEKR
jgi:hypothetical protein